jgi:prevent-host-death family protein
MSMVMAMNKAINVADLKNHLSEYLDAVEQGVEITICRRNVPFARLLGLPLRKNSTELGFDRGKVKIRGDITGPAIPESDWNAMGEPRRREP